MSGERDRNTGIEVHSVTPERWDDVLRVFGPMRRLASNAQVVSIARPPGSIRFGYSHRSMIRA